MGVTTVRQERSQCKREIAGIMVRELFWIPSLARGHNGLGESLLYEGHWPSGGSEGRGKNINADRGMLLPSGGRGSKLVKCSALVFDPLCHLVRF